MKKKNIENIVYGNNNEPILPVAVCDDFNK